MNTDNMAYFLDKNTLKIKDIMTFFDYEINIDEETNANTIISIQKEANIKNGDFVFLKRDNVLDYVGILQEITHQNNVNSYQLTCKYISNLFDRNIILKNESIISEQGVEDFIKFTIENQFSDSEDTFLNMEFLEAEVITHTKLQKEVENDNGIYNFHTFITNCTQNYNIKFEYSLTEETRKIHIKIYKEESAVCNIDATLKDVADYTEKFETNVVAKVTVLCEDKTERSWYLKNDRTITSDKNDVNRASGGIETIYIANVEDAEQAALDKFKSNTYNHAITFKLNRNTKLFSIDKLKIGTKINIKTNNNIILDTYISAIKDDGATFIEYTSGNMRINFIDKLLKERGKSK